jgi:hypothetical protein
MTSRDPVVRVPSRVTRVRGLTLRDQGSSPLLGTGGRLPRVQLVPLAAGHTTSSLAEPQPRCQLDDRGTCKGQVPKGHKGQGSDPQRSGVLVFAGHWRPPSSCPAGSSGCWPHF